MSITAPQEHASEDAGKDAPRDDSVGRGGDADRRLSASIDDPSLRAFFLQSLDLKAEGGPRWRLNFDVLEAEMSKIVGWPGTVQVLANVGFHFGIPRL